MGKMVYHKPTADAAIENGAAALAAQDSSPTPEEEPLQRELRESFEHVVQNNPFRSSDYHVRDWLERHLELLNDPEIEHIVLQIFQYISNWPLDKIIEYCNECKNLMLGDQPSTPSGSPPSSQPSTRTVTPVSSRSSSRSSSPAASRSSSESDDEEEDQLTRIAQDSFNEIAKTMPHNSMEEQMKVWYEFHSKIDEDVPLEGNRLIIFELLQNWPLEKLIAMKRAHDVAEEDEADPTVGDKKEEPSESVGEE